MSNLAIKAENISKLYRLGQVGTGTLQQDLKRWWWNLTGKGDPFSKIGETNDRTVKGTSEYVWALKDINFEVQKGEVLGIIGRNGAGKSTLLKILSKTTAPTEGAIKVAGRIASLLEVGTGFHPELTGRENIFLNGAILGMTRREIRSKFDEIVDFSGVERYIDTPVKRYSSGMYVRLAFAVAAHLEPEILIVDEVLAVGDAEFQKKCLGKMKNVSVNEGRTVLFVSHNMAAVESLCTQGILMKNGGIDYNSDINDVIKKYKSDIKVSSFFIDLKPDPNSIADINRVEILNENDEYVQTFNSGEKMKFRIHINLKQKLINPILSLRISNSSSENIVVWRSSNFKESPLKSFDKPSNYVLDITSEELYLLNDFYDISIGFFDDKGQDLNIYHQNILNFEVIASKPDEGFNIITKENSSNTIVFYPSKWSIYEK